MFGQYRRQGRKKRQKTVKKQDNINDNLNDSRRFIGYKHRGTSFPVFRNEWVLILNKSMIFLLYHKSAID